MNSTSKRVTAQVKEKLGYDPGVHINEPCKVCGRKAVFKVDQDKWFKFVCYFCEGKI